MEKSVSGMHGWIPGTYDLRWPAAVTTADVFICRMDDRGRVWVLTGVRSPGSRFEPGKIILAFGGFVDVEKDTSVDETARREAEEELPGLPIEVQARPLIVTGPWKYSYEWDPEIRRARNTGELVQDIPVVTVTYLARCCSAYTPESEEVRSTRWVPFEELLATRRCYAFDQALVLEAALRNLVI